MAIGNQLNDGYKNFYVKLVGTKRGSKECYFEFKTKAEGTYVVEQKSNEYSGTCEKIELKTFQYEGKEGKSLEISLRDDTEKHRYILSLGINNVSRGLLSSLDSLDEISQLRFVTFIGKNKKDEPQLIFLAYANGSSEKLMWSHNIADLFKKLVKSVKVNGETINDYGELNEFFLGSVLPSVKSKINSLGQGESTEGIPEEEVNGVDEEYEEDLDLPF